MRSSLVLFSFNLLVFLFRDVKEKTYIQCTVHTSISFCMVLGFSLLFLSLFCWVSFLELLNFSFAKGKKGHETLSILFDKWIYYACKGFEFDISTILHEIFGIVFSFSFFFKLTAQSSNCRIYLHVWNASNNTDAQCYIEISLSIVIFRIDDLTPHTQTYRNFICKTNCTMCLVDNDGKRERRKKIVYIFHLWIVNSHNNFSSWLFVCVCNYIRKWQKKSWTSFTLAYKQFHNQTHTHKRNDFCHFILLNLIPFCCSCCRRRRCCCLRENFKRKKNDRIKTVNCAKQKHLHSFECI